MTEKIRINGWECEILPEYNTERYREELKELLQNHLYNVNTNWQEYRRIGKRWKNKRKTS